MKNAIILHGTSGNANENWFPWLKKKLEAKDYSVYVPNLPHADYPNMKTYLAFIKEKAPPINEETILVGHSSGAVAALGLLQSLPAGSVIKAAYLVGAFKDNLRWIDKQGKHVLGGLFEEDFDWKKIQASAQKIVFIHSENDPYCPLSHASFLATKLGAELVIQPHQKHFSVETMGDTYKEFPFLLEMIEHLA